MATLDKLLEDFKGYNAWELAEMADCGRPDAADSPGAQLLCTTRDAFVKEVEYVKNQIHATYDFSDMITAVADDGPSVYTHTVWTEFVDLCGYWALDEMRDEGLLTEIPEDIDGLASQACAHILRSMLQSLADTILEDGEFDTDDESDEG